MREGRRPLSPWCFCTTTTVPACEPLFLRGSVPGHARGCDLSAAHATLIGERSRKRHDCQRRHCRGKNAGFWVYLDRLGCCRLRRRTPGPPPFSSMNWIPALSSARISAATVEVCASKAPGFDSSRFMVGREIDEAFARLLWSHRRSALAARITSLVMMVMG
jgi:hypothetical protein